MRKKRHTPEEIISKLRHVDVLVAQGTPVADAIRSIGVTEVILTPQAAGNVTQRDSKSTRTTLSRGRTPNISKSILQRDPAL